MLNNIGSMVGEKVVEAVNLLSGVHKEVEEINEELESIQVFINGADRMAATTEQENKGDNGMKRKVKELREASLRIEEVTEDYMITQQQQQSHDPGCVAIFHAATNFIKTMFRRLRVSYEIQDIKTSIREINERSGLQIQSFLEQGSTSGSQNVLSQHALRRNALYVEEDDVVGFESPKHELIGWLKETQPKRTVIIVVGMGGQGKTTLAKIVYDKVIGDFDCHAWITVSQAYSIEDLLRTMLKKLGENRNDVSVMDLESLTNEVRKCLSQKRYVVFFDDVWNKDFWSEIESVVLNDKNRSRVVITTRDMEVANFCKKSSFHIHNLQRLSSQESMKLFCKKAFQNEPDDICLAGLEEISSNIVEKCEGLPLAIVAIGSLIACNGKNSLQLQKLCKALNYELDKNPNSTSITNILGLSYDVLPYHLKPCFLYFGIYPEDYEVNSKRLIRQWIAEGFVKSDERHETLEEVGEQYLKELIQRSLVQAFLFSVDGKPKRCRVHDLLRDMILTKIKDLGFCHFVSDDADNQSKLNGKIRRLQITIYSVGIHLKDSNIEGSLIRSLHVFRNKGLPEDLGRILPTECIRLKVFELHWPNYIPENCGNLIHLRYLSLWNDQYMRSLPESIGNLQNLETLDLKGLFALSLPREINKLRKLRHLIRLSKMMGGVRGLESLQTLYLVDTEEWGEEFFEELQELKQLRSLGLLSVEPKYLSTLCCSINNMQHLEKLYIDVTGRTDYGCISPILTLQKLQLVGKLERFEEWIPKHRNLVKLTLTNSYLIDDPMKSLMHLPNLLSLFLWNAYEGKTLHFENGMFQKLKKLDLRCLVPLNSVHIGEGALPLLKQLKLEFIHELEEVPSGMDQLGKLQVFSIKSMPQKFVDLIRQNIWVQNNVPTVIY
ncbi:hypothetical protein TanjilG_22640 [Lupinus angustifolius]|uniref:NB-ARC domain-containing protein n=1 Tax=Lupinus angustifolius TaxID=3871 RepID=A0A4P1RTJ6_LUPAN|nr:PREDICTED: disease resistance protein RPM1-like [Lupinus angustifolius]OIW17528.1 hypothetical protein TanjilG_22640 [Lupinus angustifolius]